MSTNQQPIVNIKGKLLIVAEQMVAACPDFDIGPTPQRRYIRGAAMISSSIYDISDGNILANMEV